MNSSQNFHKLIFRKLKLSDYQEFEKLFKKLIRKKLVMNFLNGDIF